VHVETKLPKMSINSVGASDEVLARLEDKCAVIGEERCPKVEGRGASLSEGVVLTGILIGFFFI
jgi:hypothetical protein